MKAAVTLHRVREVRPIRRPPNLINFQVEQGVYIVPKVLERGYLVIGKQKFVFESAR